MHFILKIQCKKGLPRIAPSFQTTLYNTKSVRIDPYETHPWFAASYKKKKNNNPQGVCGFDNLH